MAAPGLAGSDGTRARVDGGAGPAGARLDGGAGPAGARVDGGAGPAGGWLRARPGLSAGLVCGFALVVVGPLLGLLWSVSAPHVDVRAGLSGGESAFAVQSTIDAYFGMICAVAGIVAGAVAYRRAADAGWPVPVGLAAGGIAGSLLAGWVGHLRRSADVLAELPPDASQLLRDLVDFQVRATGLYLVLPGTALFVLALLLWAGGTVPAASRRRR